MKQSDLLREIARHARQDHASSLFIVGWFAAAAPAEDLERLLTAVEEAETHLLPSGHLAAYAERYGRLPDRPVD